MESSIFRSRRLFYAGRRLVFTKEIWGGNKTVLTSDLVFTIIMSDFEVTFLFAEVRYGKGYKRKDT